jgi:hypothetical protein
MSSFREISPKFLIGKVSISYSLALAELRWWRTVTRKLPQWKFRKPRPALHAHHSNAAGSADMVYT